MSWFSQRRRSKADRPAVVRGPHDDPSLTDEQLIAQRTRWFEMYIALKNVIADESGGPYSCPCCGHITLSERGAYEICGECGWEDDARTTTTLTSCVVVRTVVRAWRTPAPPT